MNPLDRRALLAGAAATLAAAAARAGPVAHRVEIRGMRFSPGRLAVRPGDTVTWTNRDIAPHTATASDGSWDTGTLTKGDSATVAIVPGMEGAYFCRHHPAMKAALVLDPAG